MRELDIEYWAPRVSWNSIRSTLQIPRTRNSQSSFLQKCARAPAAVEDMELALQKDEHGGYQRIQYHLVHHSFNLRELWRSWMVYMGGLTFDSH